MQNAVEDLSNLMRRLLPVRSGRCEIWTAPPPERALWVDDDGYVFVNVRLTTFDSVEDTSPQNVKEQEVCLGEYSEYPAERWRAYLEGHLRALPAIVTTLGEQVEMALPGDLFVYSSTLDDETLQDADGFAQLLSDPERLRVMNETRALEEWRDMLEPCGLGDYVNEVRAMGRRALRMVLEKVEHDDFEDEDDFEDVEEEVDEIERPVGTSRVGGDPDVPPEFEWPMAEDVPLTFVAQINLEEVAGSKHLSELPLGGLLSFFYAPIPPGDSYSHPVRVVHFANTDKLARRASPEGVERISEYDADFAEEKLFPSIESHFFYESVLPEEPVRAFNETLRDGKAGPEPVPFEGLTNFLSSYNDIHDDERPTHRLLGHPDSIQGDPYLDMEIDTREQRWDDWKEGTPEAYQIRKNALRWRLLLQIDAQQDGELLLNQDGGFFYFFIPADALAKHDWSQVRGILQCH